MCTAAQFAEILSFAHVFHCENRRTMHPPVAENACSTVQGCSWLCARPTRWLHGTFGLETTRKKTPAGSVAKHCWLLGTWEEGGYTHSALKFMGTVGAWLYGVHSCLSRSAACGEYWGFGCCVWLCAWFSSC